LEQSELLTADDLLPGNNGPRAANIQHSAVKIGTKLRMAVSSNFD
jgi:hypothetical protein